MEVCSWGFLTRLILLRFAVAATVINKELLLIDTIQFFCNYHPFLFMLFFTLPDPDGYIVLCRTFHTAPSQIQIPFPISTAQCRMGFQLGLESESESAIINKPLHVRIFL